MVKLAVEKTTGKEWAVKIIDLPLNGTCADNLNTRLVGWWVELGWLVELACLLVCLSLR